jgi:serine-type D-Ala-D-Ala carboxypeptidase/endopeptidase (penicillin-binding protein 4)
MKKQLTIILAILLAAGFAQAEEPLQSRLDSVIGDTLIDNAHIGVSVYDITADSSIYNINGDRLFIPASNLKLFTSAAALELLGPAYRFETKFWTVGTILEDSTLDGSLVITGGGDPLISGRFRDRMTEVFDYWADSLIACGIKGINGSVLIDTPWFSPPELGPGWSWDDLSYWYACPVTALAFNDNCIDLKFLPGKKIGDGAEVILEPATDYIYIDRNEAVTGPAGSDFSIDYYRAPDSKKVSFFGNIAIDDTNGRRDYLSVYKPEFYCARIFRDVLISHDIKVQSDHVGYYCIPVIIRPEIPLFTWHSDSLANVIKVINKNSQNLFAEMTLKTLGALIRHDGSFKGGCAVTDSFFNTIGITSKELAMYDGSGLSYTNQVKPDAIIILLKYMHQSQNFEVYYNSLGNPEKDRSMRDRLKGISGREKVRAKGGYIQNVSTLSGYLAGPRDGHLYAFSIMVNNYTCPSSAVESWEDRLLTVLLKEF